MSANAIYLPTFMQLIGKITSIHGLKGEITFSHHLSKKTQFETWDALMIEINPKSFIPFFIEEIRTMNDEECICKLEEINNRDDAKLIVNKPIYSSMNYDIVHEKIFTIQQYIGFTIIENGVEVGEITDAMDSKVNSMFVIIKGDKEILIPSQENFIIKIDSTLKQIHMNLPEGLLDI